MKIESSFQGKEKVCAKYLTKEAQIIEKQTSPIRMGAESKELSMWVLVWWGPCKSH